MSVTLSIRSGRDRDRPGGRADVRVPVGVRHLAFSKVERQMSKRGKARSQVLYDMFQARFGVHMRTTGGLDKRRECVSVIYSCMRTDG